jgi:hypothetical protein
MWKKTRSDKTLMFGISIIPGNLPQASAADQFILKSRNVAGITAEHAGGVVFLDNNLVAFRIKPQGIAGRHVQFPAQFNGDYHTAKPVNPADNPGGFHGCFPPVSAAGRQNTAYAYHITHPPLPVSISSLIDRRNALEYNGISALYNIHPA